MTHLHFPTPRIASAFVVPLAAVLGLAACDENKSGAVDASAIPPGDVASPIGAGDDAPTTATSDGPASATNDAVPTGADASSPLSPESFPVTFANAVCDSVVACCQQAGLDSSSCKPTLQAVVAAWIASKTADPLVVWDPEASIRCIQITSAGFRACTDPSVAKQSSSDCTQMVHGTVPVGGSCTSSSQCAPSATGTTACATGVCVVREPSATPDSRHRALGEACDGTCHPSYCMWDYSSQSPALCWTDDGLYCENGVCVAPPAIGQPCTSYCPKDAHCADGFCAPNTTDGPCKDDDECLAEARCFGVSAAGPGQCALLKENGTACTSAKECSSGQCLAGACRPWSMANDRVCSGVIF
jgi:hypothetical protein